MSEEQVKVLLIEDDVRVRELYELVLKMDEYQVVTPRLVKMVLKKLPAKTLT